MTCALLVPAALRAQDVTPIDAVVTHVNVRANPPADTTRVGALNPGETAALLDSIPSFYKVRLDNAVEGFVSKRWTRIIEAARVDFKIHFLDDGRGDVAIIDVGEHEIIVDGGFSTRVLHDYNRDRKIIDGPIELIIVTHADSDHWRGLRRILGFDTIGTHPHSMLEFWVEQIDAATQRRPLENFIEPAVDSGGLELVPLPNLPEVKLTLLHSEKDPGGGDCSYQINNASIVFMAEIDTFRFLFTGDANGKERDELGPGTPGHVEAMLLNL